MAGHAYTHWNLALFAVWLSGKWTRSRWALPLGSVLWCNSLGVVASYESVRILNGNAYAGFLKSVSPWREDVIAHWAEHVLTPVHVQGYAAHCHYLVPGRAYTPYL